MELLIHMIGYLLIFVAIDYKRPSENRAPLFSWDWFVQIILVVIATHLLEVRLS